MKKELIYLLFTILAIMITFTTLAGVISFYENNQVNSETHSMKVKVDKLSNTLNSEQSELDKLKLELIKSQTSYDSISDNLDVLLSKDNSNNNISLLRSELQTVKQRNANLKNEINLLEAQLK